MGEVKRFRLVLDPGESRVERLTLEEDGERIAQLLLLLFLLRFEVIICGRTEDELIMLFDLLGELLLLLPLADSGAVFELRLDFEILREDEILLFPLLIAGPEIATEGGLIVGDGVM